MKRGIAAILAFPVLFLVLLAIPMLSDGDDINNMACLPGQAPGGGASDVRIVQANLKVTLSGAQFKDDMATVLAQEPDFVSLNEAQSRSAAQITPDGYNSYRAPMNPYGKQSRQALSTAVLWRTDRWAPVTKGTAQLTKPVTGVKNDYRYASWVTLRSSDGARQVSVISAHLMTDPSGSARARQTEAQRGATALATLARSLQTAGPVLLAGDLNSPYPRSGGDGQWWGPKPLLDRAGMTSTFAELGAPPQGWSTHDGGGTIDWILGSKSTLRAKSHATFALKSDHRGVVADFAATSAGQGTTASNAAAAGSRTVASVPGFNAEQVRNAAAVVAAGKALNVPERGIAIGLMTAYGESNLINVDHGDAVGPDSRGIFQQRDNGAWGSYADRMNPTRAAASFFTKLLEVPGWQSMEPTLAAHAVQINADPYHYAKYWSIGLKLYGALEGTDAASLANPSEVVCAEPAAGSTGMQFTPSGVAYVGAYAPDELMARARRYDTAGGSDPYFGDNAGWYRLCQHFAANLSGRSSSGFPTAADGWSHFVATGAAHPATAKDGQAPPVGAWLYWKGSDPAGHVAVYLGNGLIATTDLPDSNEIGIVPATDPVTKWNQNYLGWAAPWAAAGTGSKAA